MVRGRRADANPFCLFCLLSSDASKREHVMQLRLSEDYPRSAPTVQVDLPLPFNHAFTDAAESSSAIAAAASAASSSAASAASASPMSALYTRFSRLVSLCEPFWTSLDYLSAHSWILEPEAPIPRSSVHRRLALGAGVWCDCTFDALDPLAQPPTLKILGNESVVEPMERACRDRIQRGLWTRDEVTAEATAAATDAVAMDDSEGPSAAAASAAAPTAAAAASPSAAALVSASPSLLHDRLLRVLGLSSFPLSTPTNRDEFRLECMVCLVYKLEEVRRHAREPRTCRIESKRRSLLPLCDRSLLSDRKHRTSCAPIHRVAVPLTPIRV